MAGERSIQVTFCDAASGAVFGQAEMSAANIPKSFEAHTTLNLEGQDWEVVTAEPMTRDEYEKAGTLRLTLRKVRIGTISPKNVLFSLPTICDKIPGIDPGTSKLGKKTVELHEDDWRQVELVAQCHQAEIDVCLSHIRRIYTEQRTDNGFFRKLHVRKEVAAPLEGGGLLFTDLRRFLPTLTALDGLSYRGVAGLIADGFAFESAFGLRLYGVRQGVAVTILGLSVEHAGPQVERDGPSLATLMRANELCLIDWCGLRQLPDSDAEVAAWLRSRAAGAR